MQSERGFVVVLVVITIGYCLLILSSEHVGWLKARRPQIVQALVIVLLVVVTVYLFSMVLPGIAHVD